MEAEDIDDDELKLIKKAAQLLNPKIISYSYEQVAKIMNSEFPVDYPITNTNMSAFQMACSMPDNTEVRQESNQKMLEIIWEHEPCMTYKDVFGRTALLLAAKGSNETAVDFILENQTPEQLGEYIDEESLGGQTALINAAEVGHMQICVNLLRAGADPFKKDKMGRSALDYAKLTPSSEIHEMLE